MNEDLGAGESVCERLHLAFGGLAGPPYGVHITPPVLMGFHQKPG